jgi:hypothetical protein
MTGPLIITLETSPELSAQLRQLQTAFAEVCNAIAPVVQETRCWNRVALHHIVYRNLRERFPQLGSQMVCNAIYSVSRTCRIIFQNPNSPFSVNRQPERPLPVYFDRHTLSIRDGIISMYTLDGRIRFKLSISPADEQRFRQEKLREIVLSNQAGLYRLGFVFAQESDQPMDVTDDNSDLGHQGSQGNRREITEAGRETPAILPEYIVLLDGSNTRNEIELGDAA